MIKSTRTSEEEKYIKESEIFEKDKNDITNNEFINIFDDELKPDIISPSIEILNGTENLQSFDENIGEKKIKDEVFVKYDDTIFNGWKSIDSDIILHELPRNGMPVRLSEFPEGNGTLSFWKRTRSFQAKRWQDTGKWCDFMTGSTLIFDPKYWKGRNE